VQLSPRYDGGPILEVRFPAGSPAVPLLRQRRRLASTLAGLDDAQWAAESRCAGWSVKDVVAHLVSTNQFWTFSIGAGRAGEPTRFLATFDPVRSPEALVDATRSQSPGEVLAAFVDGTEQLAAAIDGLGDDDWDGLVGEAPPGRVPLRGVVLHALWDGWVHERDVVLPLGLPAVEEADEVLGSLAYVAALSPLFGAAERTGLLVVEAVDPSATFAVDVAADGVVRLRPPGEVELEGEGASVHLRGDAVALVEGLSFRAPLPQLDDVAAEQRWLFEGLGTVFDRAG
jgi:uncharacterized protein (TIGR03083 family)